MIKSTLKKIGKSALGIVCLGLGSYVGLMTSAALMNTLKLTDNKDNKTE